jgi:cytochrome c553
MKHHLLLATSILVLTIVSAGAADAKENWAKHCAKCHGADGKGQTAMGKKLKVKDYTDPKFQADLKDEPSIKLIKEGKKEGTRTLMNAFNETLSEQEIKDLIAYIRTFKK